MLRLEGQVIAGHGVASGRSAGTPSNPYPQGSIAMQAPHFKERGLDLADCFLGTLNLSIAPQCWQLRRADHRFEHLTWTHLHPPETFSFVRLHALWQGHKYAGWLYYPHPETKAQHFQPPSMMELILPRLEGLSPGQALSIELAADAISLSDRA